MNILYISHLSTNIAAGLNWSVPASVNAQSKIDNVLWVNMTDCLMPHWKEVKAYHNIREYDGNLNSLDCLPPPFNNPNVVVFEGFYYMDDVRIGKLLHKNKIPYIIIPRSSLTSLALHNHAWFKKWLAHLLYFDRFVKNAKAIQYLTKQEADDSIGRFKTPYFIVPNGFSTPQEQKTCFLDDGLTASFIGRLDMFQKGLDLLLDAMTELHQELLSARFHLNIYGPRRYDFYKIKEEIEKRAIEDIVTLNDEVGGGAKKNVLMNTDLFVMTSRFEGHPMGLIEALAYGLPCLVTPGTNMLKEIQISDAGWTCEGNIKDIKHSLMKVLSQKSLFEIKGKNARKLSLNYDWDKIAKTFHDKILCLLEDNNDIGFVSAKQI